VLEALVRATGGRFSGVRYSVGYDADPTIGNSRPDSAPHMYARPELLLSGKPPNVACDCPASEISAAET
jgi:hypothetical protein